MPALRGSDDLDQGELALRALPLQGGLLPNWTGLLHWQWRSKLERLHGGLISHEHRFESGLRSLPTERPKQAAAGTGLAPGSTTQVGDIFPPATR